MCQWKEIIMERKDPTNLDDINHYEGRKYQPKIDGPAQESQETDEIYADPRDNENLPPAGVNAGELKVDDLSK